MIRKLEKTDVDKVANLWLEANLTAHDFISEKYWKDHFNMVKEQPVSYTHLTLPTNSRV